MWFMGFELVKLQRSATLGAENEIRGGVVILGGLIVRMMMVVSHDIVLSDG
jgi:hypothetical protein